VVAGSGKIKVYANVVFPVVYSMRLPRSGSLGDRGGDVQPKKSSQKIEKVLGGALRRGEGVEKTRAKGPERVPRKLRGGEVKKKGLSVRDPPASL